MCRRPQRKRFASIPNKTIRIRCRSSVSSRVNAPRLRFCRRCSAHDVLIVGRPVGKAGGTTLPLEYGDGMTLLQRNTTTVRGLIQRDFSDGVVQYSSRGIARDSSTLGSATGRPCDRTGRTVTVAVELRRRNRYSDTVSTARRLRARILLRARGRERARGGL